MGDRVMPLFLVYLDDHCVSHGTGCLDWLYDELKRRNGGELPNWCKDLMWDDIEDFVLFPEGYLALADECGNIACCPDGLFRLVWMNRPGA
jgi:hypothetical protein